MWLWVAIEPKDKEILSITISKERNMFVAERFLSNLLKKYGKHPLFQQTMKELGILFKPASF
jgi:putative transposase